METAVPIPAPALWSLGHSTLSLTDFLALLCEHRLERLVDVRRLPRSRRHPHFSREPLALALARAGVDYVHLEALGGHREPRANSPNTGLPSGPFRGYADHMATPAFAEGLVRLAELARERRTAVMCAESRWSDCHRRLLCDRLVLDGASVVHVRRGAPDEPHRPSPGARLEHGALVYRAAAGPGLFG